MKRSSVFYGPLVHAVDAQTVEYNPRALVVVDTNGKIFTMKSNVARDDLLKVLTDIGIENQKGVRILSEREFLMPGFIDTHNHACQWAQRGLGGGLHILDWLDKITFPNESKFSDAQYARKVFTSCVDGFLKQGVTTCSYYSSLHGEATKALADICLDKGQRAFIGKCNMNRNAPDYYKDKDAEESLQVTEDVIRYVRGIDPTAESILPVLTPRFAICCDHDLLTGLGVLAATNPDLPIQTHFNEARQEIDETLQLFPDFKNEADLYESYGLLTPRSILAHCTHMTDYEIERIRELGCGVAHCPISNTTVGGGFMAAPIRTFLDRGINVGLGTDNGGGFSSSMLDTIRQAIIVSNARELMNGERRLCFEECFYLSTLGGAQVCRLDHKIGNFVVGKDFDALVIDTSPQVGVMTMVEDHDALETLFEKFLMTGDDRNITNVYVRGRSVKET